MIEKLRKAGFDVFPPRPWISGTVSALEEYGPYADFFAWECWINKLIDNESWDDLDIWARTAVYAAMCDACGFSARAVASLSATEHSSRTDAAAVGERPVGSGTE